MIDVMNNISLFQNIIIIKLLKLNIDLTSEDFTGRVTLILANNFVTKCRLSMVLQHNFFYIPTYFLTHMLC